MKVDSNENDVRLEKCPILKDLYHEEEDFLKAIESIPNKASCGPDGWSATLIKNIKHPLSRFLARIFRKTMNKGKFPEILKHTFIIGIFKSGDRTAAANYRPIALTSHLSKILERVVRKDLVDFLSTNKLMDPRQHGSRAGHSTLSQLLQHYGNILDHMENKVNTDVIYLDFSKAFDKVDHSVLLSKVRALGIQGNLGAWLGTFLLGRTQKVKVGDTLSDGETIISGVPQ